MVAGAAVVENVAQSTRKQSIQSADRNLYSSIINFDRGRIKFHCVVKSAMIPVKAALAVAKKP